MGNGFEDVDWVTTSKGVFASGVGVVYILRHDEGGQGSVMVKFCVTLIRVKCRAAWVGQRGKRFVWNTGIVKLCVGGSFVLKAGCFVKTKKHSLWRL